MKQLLLFCFLVSASMAHSQITFFEPDTGIYDLILLEDGNIAVLVTGRVYKFDTELNQIWVSEPLEFADYSSLARLFELPDGKIIVFYNDMLQTLSSTGELISTVDINDYNFYQVDQQADGFQLMTQSYAAGSFFLDQYKFLNDGTLDWNFSHLLGSEYCWGELFFVQEGTANYIRQDVEWFGTGDSLKVSQYDTLGSIVYDIGGSVGARISGITEVEGGAIIYGTDDAYYKYYISKINLDGSTAWETFTYPESDPFWASDTIFHTIETWNDNYVRAIYAVNEITMNGYYRLYYYSSGGDSIYTGPRFLETNMADDNYLIKKFIQTGVNQFAFIGDYYNGIDNNSFLLLTDTIGNILKLTVTGMVYYDVNFNDLWDADEPQFPNQFIVSDPYPFGSVTNSEGIYDLNLFTEGLYINSLILPLYWDICEPASYTVELNDITSGDTITNSDYLLSYSTPATDVTITLHQSPVVIGLESTCTVTLNNFGNQTVNDFTVSLHHPSCLNLISTDPPYTTYTDTIFTWDLTDFDPYDNIQITVNYLTDDDPGLVGIVYNEFAYFSTIADDLNLADNTDTINEIVFSSFDPNHKTASPQGIGPTGTTDPATEWMNYTIDFQNTGTSPAINIKITDEIDPDFDLYSLQMLASDHNYWMELSLPNLITWHFDEIYLPDSTSDLLGSMGFLQYRIKLNEDAGIGTQLTNTAGIYFDFNDPVITNTTLNTLEEPQIAIENVTNNSFFTIYPNPFGSSFVIQLEHASDEMMIAEIRNIEGQKVSETIIPPGTNSFTISNITCAPGLYFVRICSATAVLSENYPVIRIAN